MRDEFIHLSSILFCWDENSTGGGFGKKAINAMNNNAENDWRELAKNWAIGLLSGISSIKVDIGIGYAMIIWSINENSIHYLFS